MKGFRSVYHENENNSECYSVDCIMERTNNAYWLVYIGNVVIKYYLVS